MEGSPRSRAAIANDLRALGVTLGDLVTVHASLKAIGPVEGGADGVIDAIRAAFGDTGTMLMVLGARDDHAWVIERPEAGRPELLRDATPFDAATTPADPEVGVLAEVFGTRPETRVSDGTRPETRVSDHPEARFGAAGPLADALLSDPPGTTTSGPVRLSSASSSMAAGSCASAPTPTA